MRGRSSMATSGGRRAGAAIVASYVAVCAVTIGLSGRHVRPLFEGIGPSSPYRWVKPPPLFAPGNVTPTAVKTEFAFADMGTPFQVTTGDGQFSLNIPASGVTPRTGAQTTRFVLTPVDPATLGPLPAGLRPAGNAYDAVLTYQPGGGDATPLARPGNVTLVVPEPVVTIVYSPDGRVWQRVATQTLANATTVATTFSAGGWYLGAADAATAAPGGLAGKPASGRRISTLLIVGLAVALTLALVGIPAGLRRRHSPPGPRRAAPRTRPKKTG